MKPGLVETRSGSAATQRSPDRPTYAETDYPRRAFGWSSLHSLPRGKYLFISAPSASFTIKLAIPPPHTISPIFFQQ